MTAPTLASPAAEIRRLRAERDKARRQLAQLQAVIVAPDPTQDIEYWRSLFADAHRGELEALTAERDALAAELRNRDRAWIEAATPIARRGPTFADLELRRWGPGGRAHFGDPRPGDYMGGPVPTW